MMEPSNDTIQILNAGDITLRTENAGINKVMNSGTSGTLEIERKLVNDYERRNSAQCLSGLYDDPPKCVHGPYDGGHHHRCALARHRRGQWVAKHF
jgi:hypothetical protein